LPNGRFTLLEDELYGYGDYGKKWLGRFQQIYIENQIIILTLQLTSVSDGGMRQTRFDTTHR
jgi:hypothetical protein